MFDRSSGHIVLCLLLLASGVYVVASYDQAVALATSGDDVSSTQGWILTLRVLAVIAGGTGVLAAVGLWMRSSTGRRLGFAFVLLWILVESFALWGRFEGPAVAGSVVRDPMAPVVRLWIALSIGLFLWGWADGYVDRTGETDAA